MKKIWCAGRVLRWLSGRPTIHIIQTPEADASERIRVGMMCKNDPTDAYVANSVDIQKAWVQHLVAKWGDSQRRQVIKYYMLDNEPSIWSGTHRDTHPSLATYDEIYNDIVNYAAAIRNVDPNAIIIGPEEWSWWAMWYSEQDQKVGLNSSSSDYATHSSTYYYPYLLQKLYAYKQANGVDLINVLSVHCYTDVSSNYNVATRQLWDPNYKDTGWEGTSFGLNGGVFDWIPLMKQWVNEYYPGLQIACTEYNWDDESTLSGATTEADLLGIFGYYGFDMANIFTAPKYPTYLTLQMYRNYDGKLSTFGDTSISTTVADPDNLSAFASLRSTDGAMTVMVINKQTSSTPVNVTLANFTAGSTAQAYQVAFRKPDLDYQPRQRHGCQQRDQHHGARAKRHALRGSYIQHLRAHRHHALHLCELGLGAGILGNRHLHQRNCQPRTAADQRRLMVVVRPQQFHFDLA